MIDDMEFKRIVENYYSFLISEFGFKLSEVIANGNYFYQLRYTDKKKAITVSYENIEDYFSVFISIFTGGKMPDYDDKTKTLHLHKLNSLIIPKIDQGEIDQNSSYFLKFSPQHKFEQKLLKAAKELRLCLKHYDKQ